MITPTHACDTDTYYCIYYSSKGMDKLFQSRTQNTIYYNCVFLLSYLLFLELFFVILSRWLEEKKLGGMTLDKKINKKII